MKELKGRTLASGWGRRRQWNPVKELKEIYDFFSHHPDARMWNPVKELKEELEAHVEIVVPDPRWNPVKELKVRKLRLGKSFN